MSVSSNTRVLSTLKGILRFIDIQMKVKSPFRNHDKVTERRTEVFLATILNELLAAREPEWGFQSLAVHPPTWQALRKPKAWELGTSVLFDLRSPTSLPCWTEEPMRHHVKSVVPFLRNNCCPCLQTPNNSEMWLVIPALPFSPRPHLPLVSVPKSGFGSQQSHELAAGSWVAELAGKHAGFCLADIAPMEPCLSPSRAFWK